MPGFEQDAAFINGTGAGQYFLATFRRYGLFTNDPTNPTNIPELAAPTDGNPEIPAAAWQTITAWSHQSQVATPQPFVQPGRGIPGLLTYLETGMNLTVNETIPSPAGPLIINGTATLTIDWGDGNTTTGVTDPGGPYPDGALTHHYPNSGDYNITVTAHWTINYQLAGTTGIIPLTTTGTLPNFPVRSLRAVARPINSHEGD
ncbi:MAG: hypothetical protein KDB86_09670 [Actinobacteria bacterium]|nr:hypothetical protein [Actinomycetota bacterium]